jgi:2-amino-4-hydroxy-6-hydroxymethyldihydropteridine diphosphokinase
LGTNLGDREDWLARALDALQALDSTMVVVYSSCYETEPVGITDQPRFLNMAAAIETAMTPLEMLDAIKAIETRLGRQRRDRWGPREIDIDIVLWDQQVVQGERLTLPHPEFRGRAFVLEPLREIAADVTDPVTGKTVEELADVLYAQLPELRHDIVKCQKLALTP